MSKPPLDPLTWTILNRLLDEALEQAPGDLERWIDALPPEHEALKPRLRSMLSRVNLVETGDFLQTLPKLPLAPGDLAAAEVHVDKPGDVIGAYRLLRELGSGGMGVVWLAERTDGLINRPVALKLPHGAWKRAGLAERMAMEREILASLTHPNIAHLYDAGVTADGQPFLALEFVEGVRIDKYAAALPLAQRLRLFAQAANAVAFAHGKLVVHRDLKPANILVTADGQVRLLDFGIAKLLGTRAPDSQLTADSARALTPDYAAPEQITGEPLSIATDVYSLGVVLYELLTGRRPYKLQRDSRGALEDAILDAEPPLPSSVADPAHRKALRGDLDTVVLKALKKDPSKRYLTVHALLDDIWRYLDSRPVLAQPDSHWYRARKFVRRNLVPVSAAGAIAIALLAGAGVATWQARVAKAEQRRAEEVKDFITSIFSQASPYSGGATSLTAIDLLKQADERLNAAQISEPSVHTELATLIGESLMALGDLDDAEPLLERTSADAHESLGAAHELTMRVDLLRAQMHRMRGRATDASAVLDDILPRMRANKATKPLDLAGALSHRTLIAMEQGAYPEAEAFAAESARIATTRLAKGDDQAITSSILLALAYRYTNKLVESRDAGKQALQAALDAYGSAEPHPRVVEAKSTYGRALGDNGELAEGLALMDEAVRDIRKLTGDDSVQAGIFLQNQVSYRIEHGDLALAERTADEAMKILSDKVQRESLTFAATLSSRAQARLALGNYAGALADFEEVVPLLNKVPGPEGEFTLLARACRAMTLGHLGRLDEARAEIEAVAPLAEKQPKLEALNARVNRTRGALLRMAEDYQGALQWQEKVLATTSTLPKMQRERMRARAESGKALLALGERERAVAALEQSLEEFRQLESQPTPAQAEASAALLLAKNAPPGR